MPYVTDNKISKSPIEGGVEISDEKYSELLSAMSSGHKIKVKDGEPVILSRNTRTVYSTEDGSKKQIAENDDTPDGYTDDEPGRFDEWDGSKWVTDTESEAAHEYAQALSRLKSAHAEALSDAHDRYAPTEREGWHELVKDAEDGSGECLEAYAEDLGVSVSDAADRVLASRDKYRAAYGKATGRLTKLRDEADALYEAGDVDGLKALEW